MSKNDDITKLRDKIAIAAMQAIISKSPFEHTPPGEVEHKMQSTAIGAYLYADYMIKARNCDLSEL